MLSDTQEIVSLELGFVGPSGTCFARFLKTCEQLSEGSCLPNKNLLTTIMARPTMNTVQTDSVYYVVNVVGEKVVVYMSYKAFRREVYHKRNKRVSNYVYRHRNKVDYSEKVRIYKRVYKYTSSLDDKTDVQKCALAAIKLIDEKCKPLLSSLSKQHAEEYRVHYNRKSWLARNDDAYLKQRMTTYHMAIMSYVMKSLELPEFTMSECRVYLKANIRTCPVCIEAVKYARDLHNELYPDWYMTPNPMDLVHQDEEVHLHKELLTQWCDERIPVGYSPQHEQKKSSDNFFFSFKKDRKHKIDRDKKKKIALKKLKKQDDEDDHYLQSVVRCNTDSDNEQEPFRVPPVDEDNIPNYEAEGQWTDQQRAEYYERRYYDHIHNQMNGDELQTFLIKLRMTAINIATARHNVSRAKLMPKLSIDQHALIKMCESAIVSWLALRQCTTWKHFGTVLCTIYCVSQESSMVLTVTNYILSLFDNCDLRQQDENDEDKSKYEVTYILRNILSIWKDVRHSYLINSLKKTLGILILMGYVQKDDVPMDIGKFEHVFKCAESQSFQKLDAIEWLLDFSAFIIEKGIAIYNGDSLMTFFYHDTASMKLQEDYTYLVSHFPLWDNGQLAKVKSDDTEYKIRLHRCLQSLQRLAKNTPKGPESTILNQKVMKLMDINVKIIEKENNETLREAPYAIKIFGDSGVGKSACLPILQNFLLRVNGFDPSKEGIVALNPSEKHQSELENKHICITFDDAGNQKFLASTGNHIDLFMKFVNNNMVHAIKAELSQKGNVLVKPKFLFVTTNIETMDAESYSNHVASALRRAPIHITMKVKDEYKKPGTDMLDPARMIRPVENAWLFTVKHCVPTITEAGKSSFYLGITKYDFGNGEIPLVDIDLPQLLKFMSWQSQDHFVHQRRLLQNVDVIHETPLCPHGIYNDICIDCMQHQDDDSEIRWDRFKSIPTIVHRIAQSKFIMPLQSKVSQVIQRSSYIKDIPTRCVISAAIECVTFAVIASTVFTTHTLAVASLCLVSTVILSVAYMKSEVIKVAESCVNIPLDVIKKSYNGMVAAKKVIAGLTLLFLVKKAYDLFKGDGEQDLQPQGSIPVIPKKDPNKDETNMWRKAQVLPVEVSLNAATMTHEQLSGVVSGVLARACFHEEGTDKGFRVNIFPVGNNLWIAPWHTLVRGSKRVTVSYHDSGVNGPNFTAVIDTKITQRIGNTDLGLIMLSKGGDRRDMFQYFPRSITAHKTPATFIHRKKEDHTISVDHVSVKYRPVDLDDASYHGVDYNLPYNTFDGLCIGTLVAETKKPYIIGFHVLGEDGKPYGIAQQVTRCELEATRSLLYAASNVAFKVHHSKVIDFDMPERGLFVNRSVHEKSPSNFLPDDSTLNVVGSHSMPRRHLKSAVVPTPISDLVHQHLGVESKHGPPNLSGWAPWQEELAKISNTCELEIPMLDLAYADFKADIDQCIIDNPEDVKQISPLHIHANLAGVDGVDVYNAIDRSTSMGWPHNTPKKHFIIPLEEEVEGITCPMQMVPELAQEVEKAREELLTGSRCNFIGRGSLKDEATKKTKTKVRVFVASPAALIVLMREFFLPIIKFIQEHADVFECAVGTNAYGPDWSNIAERIQAKVTDENRKKNIERCLAGDFKAFDSCMSAMMVLLAFKLMIHIAKEAGYNDDQILIMHGIATEIAYYFMEFHGEFQKASGSNPSGHTGTVIVNDIDNSLYMRYVYYHVYDGKPPGRFKENVSLVTYGDDNAMSVTDKVADKFNHTTIAHVLGLSGIQYTMADKTSESVPFIPFSDITFLKRSFRWSEKYNQWLGPIEEDSIFKSLHAVVKSKVLTLQQQSAEVVKNACREYFYYGEEVYNMRAQQLQKVVDESGFAHVFDDIPSFMELEDEYISNYC
jgi:hypothetical protein